MAGGLVAGNPDSHVGHVNRRATEGDTSTNIRQGRAFNFESNVVHNLYGWGHFQTS